MRTIPCLSLLLLIALSSNATSGPSPPVGEAWREDLQMVAREMPRIHPNLFYRMSRASWDSAVTSLDRHLPAMSRDQALIALMKLVAMAHDGHTSINPVFDRALGFRYYPIQLEAFDDGVFVVAADKGYERCVGARVTAIGKAKIEDAMTAVATTISSENEWWSRAWTPQRLTMPEILDGLGLVDDMERLPLRFERNGKSEVVVLKPAGVLEPQGHNPIGAVDRTGWVSMRRGEAPLSQRNPGVPYWVTYVQKDRTLYVCYRAVMTMDPAHGETSTDFWRRVFALADSLGPERFVLDLRENGGGNNFLNRQVVRGLLRRAAIDRRDRLFVVTSGRTFSAAMNLAVDLEKWSEATFVGQPTGNALNFYGDARPLVLPKSGISVNVSTLPWRPYDPRDSRDFIAPRIYTPMTSTQYAKGQDPAMEAILAFGSQGNPMSGVETAVMRGDSAEAERVFERARRDPINRFRSFEAELNLLGYSLLNAGHSPQAITVFRMNSRAYPGSANVWDSLGEALALAGMKEPAIAAYRKALDLDPQFRSSRDALARLGASH